MAAAALSAEPDAARRERLAVAAGFVVLVAVAAIWLAIDRRPPEWDYANHLERVIGCWRDLAAGDVEAVLLRSSFYPPLVPCAAGVVYALAPSDVAGAQAVVLAFLGVGMAATYALGRIVAGGPAGVVAALAFGSAPFVVYSSVHFQLDLPLAAMVALALVALLRADGFRHRGWSLATGAVLGLGLLTKPPFVAYVAPVAALVLLRARGRRAWANVGLALAIAALLALPWYGPRVFGLPAQVGARGFKQAAEAGHPSPLSWAGATFYPRWLPTQAGVLVIALFCWGLVVAVGRRLWITLAALLAPLAVLSTLQNRNLRYTLPLLPVVAVLAGLGFAALPSRARRVAAVALVLAGVAQVASTAFGIPPTATLPLLGVPWSSPSPPVAEDWRVREVLASISRDSRGAPSLVSVVPNAAYFSVSNFRYLALRDGLPLRFARAWDAEPIGVAYMVLKSGDVGPTWTAERPRRIDARLAGDAHLARVFPVIGRFPLPDGSVATVRARRLETGPDVAPAALEAALRAGITRALGDVARDVEGLRLGLAGDPAALRQGRLARLTLAADAATLGELRRPGAATLRVRDVRLVVEELLFNPWSAALASRFAPLDAARVRLESATVTADDLARFLAGLRQFHRASVRLEPGALAVSFAQWGPDVRARVRLRAATDRPFAADAERVRVGGVPVPDWLVNWVIRHYDPAPRIASRLPVPVTVGRVEITPAALRIVTP